MADPKDNGALAPVMIRPEDIAAEVKVVLTKEGRVALMGPFDNLPLIIKLLADGVEIAATLVEKAIPKRIIPATSIPDKYLVIPGGK